jgi:hypothetical protein
MNQLTCYSYLGGSIIENRAKLRKFVLHIYKPQNRTIHAIAYAVEVYTHGDDDDANLFTAFSLLLFLQLRSVPGVERPWVVSCQKHLFKEREAVFLDAFCRSFLLPRHATSIQIDLVVYWAHRSCQTIANTKAR